MTDLVIAKKLTFRKDQIHALKFAIERESAGLFMTPGFGKTMLGLAWIKACLEGYGAKRALIVAPLRPLMQAWPKEMKKWDMFKGMEGDSAILHGASKDQWFEHGYPINLINPEGLRWFMQHDRSELSKYDTIIFDESTKFKNSQSQRFKMLKPFIPQFQNRLILSGTPRPKDLADLFSQVYLLDDGHRLGQFIKHFRREYMFDQSPVDSDWPDWTAAPGAEDEVYSLIDDICMTMTDEDYEGAPPFMENVITVAMPPVARKEYNRMKRETLAMFRAKAIAPANAAGRARKMRQISAGFIYDDKKEATHVHNAKTDALCELFEQLDGRNLLVSVEHRHEYVMIFNAVKKAFGIEPPYFGQGGITAAKTQGVIDNWNSGKCPIIVAHPASAGHGLDGLQDTGNNICFFSLTTNFEYYDQIRRRLKRTGQKLTTKVHFIETENTLDAVVREGVIATRQGDQIGFFHALRNHVGA